MAPRRSLPKSITPNLQFMIVCEGVAIEEGGGGVTFRRSFDTLVVPFVPIGFPITVSVQYRGGTGTHKHWLRITEPNGDVREGPESSFWLEATKSAHRLDGRVEMLVQREGTYWIAAVLDGVEGIKVPLTITSRGLNPADVVGQLG